MTTVAVIDYGMGNLRSVAKALEHVATPSVRIRVTADPEQVRAADRVVFPGQGAAADCMRALVGLGLRSAILEAARTRPFLGICMGSQVLMERSDEDGGTECLGLFPGGVHHLGGLSQAGASAPRLKIPHMGWNQVSQQRAHPLWRDIPDETRFYFAHSYYVQPVDAELSVATTEYGAAFACALARANVFALQCHPEKSAQCGLTLLANFLTWQGEA